MAMNASAPVQKVSLYLRRSCLATDCCGDQPVNLVAEV